MTPARATLALQETTTYPTNKPTLEANPCFNSTIASEHVLECGHCITTKAPKEPCASNCFHVAEARYLANNTEKEQEALADEGATEEEFWCDACQQEGIENELILENRSADIQATDVARNKLRAYYAEMHSNERSQFRECHIETKVVPVPCDKDGDVEEIFHDMPKSHEIDTSVPRGEANMFKDFNTDPDTIETARKQREEEEDELEGHWLSTGGASLLFRYEDDHSAENQDNDDAIPKHSSVLPSIEQDNYSEYDDQENHDPEASSVRSSSQLPLVSSHPLPSAGIVIHRVNGPSASDNSTLHSSALSSPIMYRRRLPLRRSRNPSTKWQAWLERFPGITPIPTIEIGNTICSGTSGRC